MDEPESAKSKGRNSFTYRRERMADEPPDVEDNIADCSGDERGETISSNGDPVDMTADCSDDEKVETTRRNGAEMDTTRKPEPDIVTPSGQCESDDSDEELRELYEKKKRLEREKQVLSDAKQRRRAEREIIKCKLKTDVKTLETEVADLNLQYNIKGPRR